MNQAPVAQLVEHRGVSISGVLSSNLSGRACRKCGTLVPNRVRVAGKERDLRKRKFCLGCSPFGMHNTKPDDPARPAKKQVSSHLKLLQQRHARNVHQRARRLREQLIKEAGGCCTRCSYARCPNALEFHHRDPSTKLFGLTALNLRRKTLEQVQLELKKCELVCANCHREIEAGLR